MDTSIWIFGAVLLFSVLGSNGKTVEPVIIFPGLTDSTLLMKLDNAKPPHDFCPSNADWFMIWVNETYFLPHFSDCLVYYLQLHFNETKFSYSNSEGVTMKILPGLDGIKWLATMSKPYFEKLIDYFKTHAGYVEDVSLIGFPYDWRPGLVYYMKDGQYESLKKTVEDTYEKNGGAKVNFLTHSFGGQFAYYFLRNYVSQDWKDKYMASMITMGSPWTGSAMGIQTMVNSKILGPMFGSSIFQEFWRDMGSFVSMFPVPKYWGDKTVVVTKSKNYTASMFGELLDMAGASVTKEIYELTKDKYSSVDPPGVNSYCLMGYGIPTVAGYAYKTDDVTNEIPEPFNDDGDATVTTDSLMECATWKGDDPHHNTELWRYFNMTHDAMVYDEGVFEDILSVTVKN